MYITKSERLSYRKITGCDFNELKIMLGDPKVMYAWEHTFSDEQIYQWIEKQEEYYRQDGVGYFAAINRFSNELVGQVGLHRFLYNGEIEYEVCYMLKQQYFQQGYALEGVNAMVNYAFSKLMLPYIYAQIKTDNNPSIKVAEKAGFVKLGMLNKYYNGKNMSHYLYIRKKDFCV